MQVATPKLKTKHKMAQARNFAQAVCDTMGLDCQTIIPRYGNNTAGQRLQLGRVKQAAPLMSPAANIHKIALEVLDLPIARIARSVVPRPAIINGQNNASLNTKMLIPTAPGYKVARTLAEIANLSAAGLAFCTFVCRLWYLPWDSAWPPRDIETDTSRAVKKAIMATQAVPAMHPASRAEKIADQENDPPGGSIAANGDKKRGYRGARKIMELGLPY